MRLRMSGWGLGKTATEKDFTDGLRMRSLLWE